MTDEMVTFTQVARTRQLCKTTIHTWRRKGLRAIKVKSVWLTTYEDVDEYIRTHHPRSSHPDYVRKPRKTRSDIHNKLFSDDDYSMSIKDIAKALGHSPQTVKAILKKAMDKLEQHVRQTHGDVDMTDFL